MAGAAEADRSLLAGDTLDAPLAWRAGQPISRRQYLADVAALAGNLNIRFVGETEADEAILVDGQDWTHEIRAEETGNLASKIATARIGLAVPPRIFSGKPMKVNSPSGS